MKKNELQKCFKKEIKKILQDFSLENHNVNNKNYCYSDIIEYNINCKENYFIEIVIIDMKDKRKSEKITIIPYFYFDPNRAGLFIPHFKNGWSSSEIIDILSKSYISNKI